MKWHAAMLIATASVFLSGCGDTGVKVSGTIMEDGAPLTPKDGELVEIVFEPLAETGRTTQGISEYDGDSKTFALQGPTSERILPGEYKVVLRCVSYDEEGEKDRFADVFSAEKTSLRYTVTDAPSQEIVIDLKNRTVTAK